MLRHILFLCDFPPARGGTKHASALLVNALADTGCRVTAVSPVSAHSVGEANDERDFRSVTVARFKMQVVVSFLGYRDVIAPKGIGFRQYYDTQAERALPIMQGIIERDPPDLVVLGHEAFLWGIVDAFKPKGIPVALIAHGPLAAIVNGGIHDHLVEPLLDHARRADLVLPVAEHTAKSIRRHGIEARVVRNIVETERFRLKPRPPHLLRTLAIGESDIVVGHASNMRPVKRPIDIVESAALALQEEPRLLYLILGDGPMREKMERRCRELDIAGRFRFAGWIPFRQMDDYLPVIDIAVLASSSEGMPYGALEPMSCRRTAIVSDLVWTEEVIGGHGPLLTFPVGDTSALADRTLRAAADAELRGRMGADGRKYVERRHRKERIVADFAAAVEPLIG